MEMLPKNGRIYVINKPISANYGIPTMLALLNANSLDVFWNGVEPITIISFNEKLTLCKIFIVDEHGITCAKRRLRVGRFKYLLRNNLLPTLIKRSELEKLLQTGTIPRINKSRY